MLVQDDGYMLSKIIGLQNLSTMEENIIFQKLLDLDAKIHSLVQMQSGYTNLNETKMKLVFFIIIIIIV